MHGGGKGGKKSAGPVGRGSQRITESQKKLSWKDLTWMSVVQHRRSPLLPSPPSGKQRGPEKGLEKASWGTARGKLALFPLGQPLPCRHALPSAPFPAPVLPSGETKQGVAGEAEGGGGAGAGPGPRGGASALSPPPAPGPAASPALLQPPCASLRPHRPHHEGAPARCAGRGAVRGER